MIVKMTILRFLGSSDDKEKEKIGVTWPEGASEASSDQEHRKNRRKGHRCIRRLSEEPAL